MLGMCAAAQLHPSPTHRQLLNLAPEASHLVI